jgi:hypothetical protein
MPDYLNKKELDKLLTKRLQNTSQETQNNIESIFLEYYLNSAV